MKPKEANAIAKKLKGLLPRMTDEQLLFVAGKLERYTLPVATRAIERYVLEFDEYSTPRLMRLLNEETLRNCAVSSEYHEQRALADQQAARDAEDDAIVAQFSDDDMSEMKRMVLAELKPEVAGVLERLNPRDSRTLKSLIADRIRGGQS